MSTMPQMLLDINAKMNYGPDGVWRADSSGSRIKRLTPATAKQLATLFDQEQTRHPDIPLSFALAIPAVESKYDPGAYNRNLNGSNPDDSLGGYDVGLCQFKVKYQQPPNCATWADVEQFLFDPVKVVPYFFAYLKALLKLAQATKFAPGHDERASNPWWVVATMYKMGPTGGIRAINAGPLKGPVTNGVYHADYGAVIAKWESQIAADLGEPSVMSTILAT